MTEKTKKELSPEEQLKRKVNAAAQKRIKAKKEGSKIMFGLGLFGMVGWSIAIPTLLGIFFGIYLDENIPVDFSWTLTLLFAGVILGSVNAWYWVKKNSKEDEEEV